MPKMIRVHSYVRSDGVVVSGHSREVITSREQGRSGEKFKSLARKVTNEYEGKPVPLKYRSLYGSTYSHKEAMEVGRKVAGKQFYGKYGKRRAKNILRRER